MSVALVISALETLRNLYEAGGATTQAKELSALIEALHPDAEVAVEEFVFRLEEAAKPQPKKPPKQPKAIDAELVNRFLQSLSHATDVDEITAVISIMKHDKVDKAHVFEIAARFTGSDSRFKTANEAFSRIRGAFIEQKRFENKLKAANLDR